MIKKCQEVTVSTLKKVNFEKCLTLIREFHEAISIGDDKPETSAKRENAEKALKQLEMISRDLNTLYNHLGGIAGDEVEETEAKGGMEPTYQCTGGREELKEKEKATEAKGGMEPSYQCTGGREELKEKEKAAEAKKMDLEPTFNTCGRGRPELKEKETEEETETDEEPTYNTCGRGRPELNPDD